MSLPPLSHIPGRIRYWMTPLFERCPETVFPERTRKVQVYVVGMPRTGTVSFYDMFKRGFRADHEPESRFLTNKVVAYRLGRLDEAAMRRYLKHRDRRLGLELDTSYLNAEVVEQLVDMFPNARFILTLRDCVSWTDAMMNFLLNMPQFMTSRKRHIREHMHVQFGAPPYEYAPEEAGIKARGLHPLSSYLKYWTHHNQKVISGVPADRLLVIKTKDISGCSPAVESFLGLPPQSLDAAVHSNAAPKRHSLLDDVPKEFLRAQVQAHCAPLMRQYFPEALERLG
jgi:hypothetical protein